MHSMDFGAGNKLVFYGPEGLIKLPRLPNCPRGTGPRSQAEKFAEKFATIMTMDDVVTESATIGSSGAEPELIRQVVENSDHKLYTLSGRTVKNYVKTHGLDNPTDADCAQILYNVAVTKPDSLQLWRFRTSDDRITRIHTSVRPHDKRDYRGPQVDAWMALLPPFASLPKELQDIFGNGNGDYSRAVSLPFAMALTEPTVHDRNSYEQVIGLYSHGYPSFYRRKTVEVMQDIAKEMVGVTHNDEVSEGQRKEAWRITRRAIRQLYHLSKGILNPVKGTI